MKKLQNSFEGFTVIELLVFVLVLSIVAVVALTNIRTLRAQNRDMTRKTDINAVYYQLESFREKNGYYPEVLSTETLKGVDTESLKDSDDLAFNAEGGKYLYKPKNCSESKCKSFVLSSELEREAPFVKQSLNN